jgi:hypothetical protein
MPPSTEEKGKKDGGDTIAYCPLRVTTLPTTGVIPPTSVLPHKGGGGWIFIII